MACMAVNAQAIKIYDEDGTLIAVYVNTADNQYKVQFSNSPGGSKDIDGKWVQLWADGPKWATYNLGGSESDVYGGYYKWGTASLESGWRMPTTAELYALMNYTYDSNKETYEPASDNLTSWEWTDKYGPGANVSGYWVYGVGVYAGNSVFFPAAGAKDLEEYNNYGRFVGTYDATPTDEDYYHEGYYWSSSDDIESLYFINDVDGGTDMSITTDYGNSSLSIRPVLNE